MKKLKEILVCGWILIIVFSPLESYLFFNGNIDSSLNFHQNTQEYNEIPNLPHISNQKSNYEIIEEVFTQLLDQYSTQGYFSQVYEPSLQATYYALYVLDAIGKLDQINQTEVTEYLMDFYDDTTHFFTDQYSNRYLNSFQYYYPLTTLLEVNCYAILSLEILDSLDLIDLQNSIDYIWSCYNPITSGFIGQPYDSSLQDPFNISTMDNTFFAIITLDLLMADWIGFSGERTALIQYINSLQITDDMDWGFGAFLNDHSNNFRSLFPPFEHIFSSYYALKSLQIFGMQNSINLNIFNQYLESLYYPSDHQFRLGEYDSALNLVTSAIGLELSDLSGLLTIDRTTVSTFILNNRNSIGNWDQAVALSGDGIYREQHELIDTFQIVRCLKGSGDINQLTIMEEDQIANSLYLYQNYKGYSLLSEDYMSMDLIYSIINSFNLFDRFPDLDIPELYNIIKGSFYDTPIEDFFVQSVIKDGELVYYFRSYPIEYHGYPKLYFSHKSTYLALDSLQKLFKLDDFALTWNLMPFINNIVDSQFLDPEFENYGAFLPQSMLTKLGSEYQNSRIHLEYSYYAIKALELLVNYLDLGNIVDLSFNKGALYGYLTRNLYEINDMIYFNPHNVSDPAKILEHNYYMVYILKALDLFDLDRNNITSLILQNIDYGNIKNIYYCYKINDILDLKIEFNISLTSNLVGKLYSENANGFYESLDHQIINQEIFLWICEMARNDDIYIQCSYKESVNLGTVNTITASFSNLIFLVYGDLTSVRFKSDQFGILDLEKQFDNSYQINFRIPEDPKFYPSVEGNLEIYDHNKLIGQFPISFQTCFEQKVNYLSIETKYSTKFQVNVSRQFSSEFHPVFNSTLYVDIFLGKQHIETKNFTRKDFGSYSEFNLIYDYNIDLVINFEISLVDEYFPDGLFLFEYSTDSNEFSPPKPPDPVKLDGNVLIIIGIAITVSLVALAIKTVGWIKIKLNKNDEEIIKKKAKANSARKENENDDNSTNKVFRDWD